jgi:acyl-[acyl carrier protein]--UDP-N-acetylglucosamine O-acyltransferase
VGAGDAAGSIRIGDGNVFREFVTLRAPAAPGSSTVIGSRGTFNVWCSLGAGARIGDDVLLQAFVGIEDGASLGDGARVGAQTVLAPGSRVGRRARILPHAPVDGAIPPFALAGGNPATVSGPAAGSRTPALDRAFRLLLEDAGAVLDVSDPDVRELADFLRRPAAAAPREAGDE